ncbi:hypothetical protein VB796_16580 [Arcicella sp. LKC2W]|uniref:hypothetical protein n=1 Tax=Arcicella sp. LKC2W TaxID=2984198 RepID=UPI002B20F6F6|nr:hypothetical protein [Arcicella sp. LKC2W]MEA5460675.1 hypothetical protein [Arcicella sp. LKC2W]
MKQKLLYIIFSFVVLTTSTGFGFLESSTIMHGRENRLMKNDSLKVASQRVNFEQNSPIIKKEAEKPTNQLTKSLIQWVANLVRNTLEIIVGIMVEAVKVVLIVVIKILFG